MLMLIPPAQKQNAWRIPSTPHCGTPLGNMCRIPSVVLDLARSASGLIPFFACGGSTTFSTLFGPASRGPLRTRAISAESERSVDHMRNQSARSKGFPWICCSGGRFYSDSLRGSPEGSPDPLFSGAVPITAVPFRAISYNLREWHPRQITEKAQ
jgi:hypothetical protein